MGNIYIHRIRGGTDAENRIISKPREILGKSHRVVSFKHWVQVKIHVPVAEKVQLSHSNQFLIITEGQHLSPAGICWSESPTKPRSQSRTLNSHHGTWKGIHVCSCMGSSGLPSQIPCILIRMCMNNIWLRAGESSLLHVMCLRNFWDERAL